MGMQDLIEAKVNKLHSNLKRDNEFTARVAEELTPVFSDPYEYELCTYRIGPYVRCALRYRGVDDSNEVGNIIEFGAGFPSFFIRVYGVSQIFDQETVEDKLADVLAPYWPTYQG